MPTETPVLTEQELCKLLQVPHDGEQVAHWCQRRGLPHVMFRNDGRAQRRFLRDQVMDWLHAESVKRSGNGKDGK